VPTAAGGRHEMSLTGGELRTYLTKDGAVAPKYVTWKGNACVPCRWLLSPGSWTTRRRRQAWCARSREQTAS